MILNINDDLIFGLLAAELEKTENFGSNAKTLGLEKIKEICKKIVKTSKKFTQSKRTFATEIFRYPKMVFIPASNHEKGSAQKHKSYKVFFIF